MSTTLDQARKSSLWKKLEEARGEIALEFFPLCEWLLSEDVHLNPRELVYLHGVTDGKKGSWGVSDVAVDTMVALVSSQREVKRVLDPCGGTGLLGACIAESISEVQLDVVAPQASLRSLLASTRLSNLHIPEAESCSALHGQPIVTSDAG